MATTTNGAGGAATPGRAGTTGASTTRVTTARTTAGGSSRVDGSSAVVADPTTTTEVTTHGRTVIDDAVVAKVAGIAAREVPGVFALGGNTARAFGAIRDAIGSSDLGQGVRVEVGETQVAVDLTIVVEYPMPMMEVAQDVRSAVTAALTTLVGLEVTEVNVAINDVNIPALNGEPTEARVQ
ncbi:MULTISPECIES: Asp23/Gls24 family envelope stress response protein [unclassified Curtobacterium]|uniref:Asp23/Gls24 family envelope stress response protein n=1 Tax=unclassified Curtobacterium TaxID=257496 RepID=UPI000DAA2DB7|nr:MULTISPECIES: Asp23/Gls24 family envelope stress response protein [unclassified Curtobacterium]PZE27936.1 Asp23/Gls24 family envelope stress response protein [Curtobacterium sp. MCBD17_028]PZE78301.1 Asp23/Gls24 family envelope stress response protein [Curtobacterium sp. MCBD17_019]PZF62461.1 Asp23/Gls24 family envelope stress response protein [Curtobacterium sp. MCBD17_034]PZM39832.1 Asp23/Gls24 family envelope stress response protein [Curtobacterium sp. MCBD17_031]